MFDYQGTSDSEVVDRLRAAERRIAVLHAEQLELIGELHRRAAGWITAPPDTPGLIDAAEVSAAELAVALRISRRSAMDRLGLALQVQHALPGTHAALSRGEVSLAKARIIAEATADLTEEHTRQVEARVLPRAGEQTPAELGAALARAVLAADPDAPAVGAPRPCGIGPCGSAPAHPTGGDGRSGARPRPHLPLVRLPATCSALRPRPHDALSPRQYGHRQPGRPVSRAPQGENPYSMADQPT